MLISPIQVIPVLDLKNEVAVHAIAGRRAHYQPIKSVLYPSADPVELARAIRDTMGLCRLYVADLDAISGQPPNLELYRRFLALGIHLVIDAGLRDMRSAARLRALDRSACTVVAGLETLAGPNALGEILHEFGAGRLLFSLDLFEGRPILAPGASWSTDDPRVIVHEAIERGVEQVLLLDLARVGTSRGVGTKALLAELHAARPEIRIIAGGGISRLEDLLDLKVAGASAALVGSALHDGRIGSVELAKLDRGDHDRDHSSR
jgi:phosphoribosylformimino-5-aminoimidazole carboxamide ribotide isomerase